MKQLGYVLDDTVRAPSLHIREESRCDDGVVITPTLSDSASDERGQRTITTDSCPR